LAAFKLGRLDLLEMHRAAFTAAGAEHAACFVYFVAVVDFP
jgi:hypothetical protein